MSKNLLIRYNHVDITHKEHVILHDIDFNIYEGEFVYIIGKVGSGKSSLLKTLYHELNIANGDAFVFDYNLRKMKSKHIPALRRRLGIVFQDFQLLIDRNVNKNLEFVLRATGWKSGHEIERRIKDVLKQVGMSTKGYKMPHQLSGGEQQRIVIARALLNSPALILADEPTGNLDAETGTQILELLRSINKEGTTVIMTTHNQDWIRKYPAKTFVCADSKLTCINEEVSVENNEE